MKKKKSEKEAPKTPAPKMEYLPKIPMTEKERQALEIELNPMPGPVIDEIGEDDWDLY